MVETREMEEMMTALPPSPTEVSAAPLIPVLIPTIHDFRYMPKNPSDCPCDECQDQIEREDALDRESIWPHKSSFHIESTTDYSTTPCICKAPIERIDDYDRKGKRQLVRSVVHVQLSLLVRRDWGVGDAGFLDVQRIHIHPGCSDKLYLLPGYVPQRVKDQIARLASTLPSGKIDG